MATLSLRGVVKKFTQQEVIKSIDLDVDDGEFVVIVLGVLVIAVGFWLFSCLLKVGFPTAIENVHNTGAEDVGDRSSTCSS